MKCNKHNKINLFPDEFPLQVGIEILLHPGLSKNTQICTQCKKTFYNVYGRKWKSNSDWYSRDLLKTAREMAKDHNFTLPIDEKNK